MCIRVIHDHFQEWKDLFFVVLRTKQIWILTFSMKSQKTSTNLSSFSDIYFVNNEFQKIWINQIIDSEPGNRI